MKYWSFLMTFLGSLAAASADVAVLTQHNNLARTGANLQETILNTANVNSNRFGLLFTRTVDDQIYAQPLVMTNVTIPGQGVHNLLLVATVNNSVYAFDADSPSVTAPYWQTNYNDTNHFIFPVRNTDMTGACGGIYTDFSGNLGIVGTPVIDPVAGTIYFVARTKFASNSVTAFYQKLHALDLTTGAEKANSPVTITATCPGNGDGSAGGVITFDPQKQNQRPGLALVNGVVYIGWSSHCDWDPYHGWVIGYNATNLQQIAAYATTPNGSEGGIWMSGQAPAADTNGNLYVSVGNGTVGNTTNGDPRDPINRGESLLKLTRSGTNMTVSSWFTPYNWSSLNAQDLDLGSCGILLVPGTSLALAGSKEGKIYVVNRDTMGGLSYSSADTNIVQSFQVTTPGGGNNNIHGGPVWWTGPASSCIYVMGESDYLRQFQFNPTNSQFLLPNFSHSPTAAPMGMPGGILSLSANGTNAGSGLVWVSHQYTGNANNEVRPGILHAYAAANVTNELWNSEQVSARDSVGTFAKFVPPTVANGKVYLATFSSRLNVYGLLPVPTVNISRSGSNVILSWATNNSLNYGLQSNTNLLATNAWKDITNSATISNGFYQLPAPATNKATFYRLKSN